MRTVARIVVASAFLLLAQAGADVAAQSTTDLLALDRYVQTTMKDWRIPGVAIGIVRGSEPMYLKGYGVRSIHTREPVTPDTLFDIGSCTKAFTSASIAMLVDEGKMNWDDKVTQSIPYFHLADPWLTRASPCAIC